MLFAIIFFPISVKNKLKKFDTACGSFKTLMTWLSINTDFISLDDFTSVFVISFTNFLVNFGFDATLLNFVL